MPRQENSSRGGRDCWLDRAARLCVCFGTDPITVWPQLLEKWLVKGPAPELGLHPACSLLFQSCSVFPSFSMV